jgi:gliding motility-associated transport system ATP-binding protein
MSDIVVADRLTKWYGPRLAIRGVSFAVAEGEVVGLLGPNGSGKSTILRILTGYLRPSAGTVRVDGLDALDQPLALRARIGYVPEDVPLYDHMRVSEFLPFMARIKGLGGRGGRAAVERVIERFRLGVVRRLQIGKLSRGYRQRVAIAQALLNEPKLLVLDEPTNGLDPAQIIEMRELIRTLGGRHTVLVASHILTEVERTVDRVLILLEGRLLGTQSLRPADGGCRWRLRLAGPAEGARACLAGIPGVLASRLEAGATGAGGAAWLVETDARAGMPEALARALVGAGFGLHELAPAPVDLEHWFLDLTRERLEVPA